MCCLKKNIRLRRKNSYPDGMDEAEARNSAPLMKEIREMLLKWEAGDSEVMDLWKKMNSWVYKGFDETYRLLGVDFDKIYYESDTYKIGRKLLFLLLKIKCFTEIPIILSGLI